VPVGSRRRQARLRDRDPFARARDVYTAPVKLALSLMLLVASSPAARADRLETHGFVEAAAGVSLPELGSRYQSFASPGFKPSVRGGIELWLIKAVGFAPELQLDVIPVNQRSTDAIYVRNVATGMDTYSMVSSFGRYRFLAGGRFLFNFGPGAAFIRILAGVDELSGSEKLTAIGMPAAGGPVTGQRLNFASTAFTVQPGIGVHFIFWRHMIIGVSIDLPIAFHDFGKPDLGGVQKFNSVDADLMGTLGYRF
jgi:hypothetical protein